MCFRCVARGLDELLDRLVDGGADFLCHQVDEQDAVEVIGFVLDAAGEKAVAGEHVGHAPFILEFYRDRVGAGDVAADFRKRKAAFLVKIVGRAAGDGDLGIGDRHRHDEVEGQFDAVELPGEIGLRVTEVDYAELEGAANLLSGEADACGRVHGGDHLASECGEVGVESGETHAFFSQDGIVVVNNSQRHRSV